MTIQELIDLGKKAKEKSEYDMMYQKVCKNEECYKWSSMACRFLEQNFPKDNDTIRFQELVKELRTSLYSENVFDEMIGIMEAVKNIDTVNKDEDIEGIISKICNNFNRFDVNIKRRHDGRETIKIKDEYDLQDALFSILKLFIEDIRKEDYVPSYGGKNSRVDFLIPSLNLAIETKMTNSNLKDKELGEQLFIDIGRYKGNKKINKLIFFVYDKNEVLINVSGIKNDIENMSTNELEIKVYICPN